MEGKAIFNKKKIFILGFGFFGVSIIWAMYNAYVPIFLKSFQLTSFVIGIIMTVDNIFAILLRSPCNVIFLLNSLCPAV